MRACHCSKLRRDITGWLSSCNTGIFFPLSLTVNIFRFQRISNESLQMYAGGAPVRGRRANDQPSSRDMGTVPDPSIIHITVKTFVDNAVDVRRLLRCV